LLERLNRRLARGDVGDLDFVRVPDELKHAVDVRGAAQENQPTADVTGTAARVDDHVHARTVHERDVTQVERDQPRLRLSLA